MPKLKLLLHTCCAPCSGFLAQTLSANYQLTIYFDNSNIYPKIEYLKRLKEVKDFFANQQINFIKTKYNHSDWQKKIEGLEHEPEKGKRCKLCYYHRLKNTASYAQKHGFDSFASTLAISPHKDVKILNNLGRALAIKYNIKFLSGDWKKQDGFKRAMALSHREGFYHQHYCGCEFSQDGKNLKKVL